MTPKQSKYNDLMEILDKINENLEQINVKLEELIKSKEALEQAATERRGELEALDVMTLLSLPDHLRKTAMILCRLGRATAGQVSEESGRARAVESGYLNQLVVMGHVKKMRGGETFTSTSNKKGGEIYDKSDSSALKPRGSGENTYRN